MASSDSHQCLPTTRGTTSLRTWRSACRSVGRCQVTDTDNLLRSETVDKIKMAESQIFDFEVPKEADWSNNTIEGLKKQNNQLMEVLLKMQKAHAAEKRHFQEVLSGIDGALSSLPERLEKIRMRNRRNLSVINGSRFFSGLPSGDAVSEGPVEFSPAEDSPPYLSSRMKCLLQKMEQLNDLVRKLNHDQEESSPIELVLNSELWAISLLKKEVISAKKHIEDNRTDTETATSCEESQKETAEDSCSKAKNSFSNELNKASNFKIFENHMMLQEEALNLLTRKIKETEEAKEGLRREKEALERELARLRAPGEREEGPEPATNRPFRLIKELKRKLEEKEKSLIAWKSKCSRLEAAGCNKNILIENERKKNSELETTVKNLKSQNKSISSHLNSLQFFNEQLRDQIEILKHQMETLAKEKVDQEQCSVQRRSKEEEQKRSESADVVEPGQETKGRRGEKRKKGKKVEKDVDNRMKEERTQYEKEMAEMTFRLLKMQNENEEFKETFKRLLMRICSVSMEREVKCICHPSHNRIREILNISPSDLQLLYSAYMKSVTAMEAEKLFNEFSSIVNGNQEGFSESLSSWMFDLVMEKLLDHGANSLGV